MAMKLLVVKVPEAYIEALDKLVKQGRYSSRSEAVRFAIRELLRRELWMYEMMDDYDDYNYDDVNSDDAEF